MESQDSWTREIRVVIPVSDVARWNATVPVLQRRLNLFTCDRWTIQFRPRPSRFAQIVPQADLIAPPFTGVSLFPGGLDSLIEAIDQPVAKRIPPLVSHAGEPSVSKALNASQTVKPAKFLKSLVGAPGLEPGTR
jgi:hypothetical protein